MVTGSVGTLESTVRTGSSVPTPGHLTLDKSLALSLSHRACGAE